MAGHFAHSFSQEGRIPSKKQLAIRAKWMPYDADLECTAIESAELLARLTALRQHRTLLLMKGDGRQCYTSLVPHFRQVP